MSLGLAPRCRCEHLNGCRILTVAPAVLPHGNSIVGKELEKDHISRRVVDVCRRGHRKMTHEDRRHGGFVERCRPWSVHCVSSPVTREAMSVPTAFGRILQKNNAEFGGNKIGPAAARRRLRNSSAKGMNNFAAA